MTIKRGISLETDVQDFELNSLAGGSLLRLSRQNSLLPEFGSLPDFSNLLTPNLKTQTFDFGEESMYVDMTAKTLEGAKNNLSNFQIENMPIKTEASATTTTAAELTSFITAVTQATTNQYSNTQTTSLPSIAQIKQESLDSVTENQKVTIHNDGTIEMGTYTSVAQESLNTADYDLQQLQAKINRATRELNIPKNPFLWNVAQVNTWVRWLFTTQYETEPMFHLNLDGTTLCMTSDIRDLVNGQEGAAEIISIEIDLWKQALSIENEMLAAQQQQQQQYIQQQAAYANEEHPVYFDLSNSRPGSLQIQKTVTPVSVIPQPQPVTSTAHTHSLNNVMSMTLNEIHQQMQFERYGQSPRSFPAHIQQQVSPTSSINSSQGWDSPRSCESGFSSMDEDAREVSPAPSIPAPAVRTHVPHSRNSIKLWQFLRSLLDQPSLTCIRWIDSEKGIFKIEDSQKVAKMWGQRKNRPAMNYDKLSRSIRQYYKKGIIKKTDNSKRLVYQFCTPYL